MLAFGCPIISPDVFARRAQPGIERAREPDSELLVFQAAGSIFRSYNLILDRATALPELEALVLVHEDTEILDERFAEKVRAALSDPDVAVAGCVGARGVRSIAWWEGAEIVGSYAHRYEEFGGGELPGPLGIRTALAASARSVDVEVVDGFLLVLSPWAVRSVRFDEGLGPHWGYDFDYCLQVRAAGKRVVVSPIEAAHHQALAVIGEEERWIAAHMRAAEKWDGRLPKPDWKLRARRGEAEAVVARLEAAATLLQADARTARHARRLGEVTDTLSWRMTAPLRAINARRLARRRTSA